ncbi:restriction endonuclease subunit S [Ruminococcus sp.]|uniref:restriction endonuclease subunit S n=1 Tax=Ruminococcus sp. TaxID=41978 RepID=UPI0025D1612E|nr:restriction endonuclease subunit S [Ruminococcus sp.]
MDKEIKERIAAINSGIIPEGYKKTKVGIVPVEWENKKLQKVCSKIIAGATPSTKIGDYWNGNIRWMSSGEINKKIICDTDTKITQLGYDSCSTKTIPEKCVLIALAGQGKTRGMVAYNLVPICTNQSLASLIPNDIFYLYLYYYLDSQYQNLRSVSSGDGSRGGLNLEIISNYNIIIPPLPEQQNIAEILSTQDKLIELQEKKIEQLKELKKAYLQKMFPKKGSKYPELRFRGFTDPWEQRKLGEVIEDSYNGQTPSRANDEYWNGDLNWLASGDLNRGIVTHTTEKITNKGLEDTRLRIVPKGTFVMAITGLEAAGTRGNCGILGIDTALNQSCMALFPNKKILDTKFLFQWYRKVGEEYGINYTQGTKQQSYNAELIQILPISFPNKEEQQKIADYFSNLDSLITLHQRKSEQEKQKKKALMQLLLTGIVRTK